MKCPVCGAENPEGQKFCGECGNRIPSTSLIASTQYGPPQLRPPYQLRVNVFCLVGAIIGVISLFLPWALGENNHPLEIANMGDWDWGHDNFRYSVAIFFIGTVIAFFCPLGGIVQFIGSLGFMMSTLSFEDARMVIWIGSAVSMISSLAVLSSLIYPIGAGFTPERKHAVERLLTVSLFRPQGK